MKPITASNKGGRSLCEGCYHLRRLVLHEVGEVKRRCHVWGDISTLPSRVTDCTNYAARDERPVFENEAWLIFVDGGKVRTLKPRTRSELQDVIDDTGMEEVQREAAN